MRTRIKICCIASAKEAAQAIAAGADAIGLVGPMPSGPGTIDTTTARDIALSTAPPVTAWLLTSEVEPERIAAHADECGATTVQIVQQVAPSVHERLMAIAPRLRRVQVIHVEGGDAHDKVDAYGTLPHAFLLDSGRPSAGELGGTGRRHDWTVSAKIVGAAPRPVFLAGGLSPQNAGDAIRAVRPFGLDVCSGLRSKSGLDAPKLTAFMAAARAADTVLRG